MQLTKQALDKQEEEDKKVDGLNDTTRSLIYRGITRAQMLVTVVNEHVPGGYFAWTNNVELDDKNEFDQEEEKKQREERARKEREAAEAKAREEELKKI